MYANLAAQVEHPAPLFKNLIKRAFFHGRDESILRVENRKNLEVSSKLHHNENTFFGVKELTLLRNRLIRIFTKFKKVKLSVWEMPFALGIISIYYFGVAVGYFATLLLPEKIQNKLDYMIMAE